ncbi:MAG TPA: glycosyltransferase family 1 protein [Bacteroidota bacterium]
MRIGIDVRKYFDFGIGTYIQNLITWCEKIGKHELVLFCTVEDHPALMRRHNSRLVTNNSSKYSLSELFTLSYQSRRLRIDVFHEPHYTLPAALKCRSVVTVHDLIHTSFPQYYSAPKRLYARQMIAHACRASDVVIADSRYVKKELITKFGLSTEKVRVVPLGVDREFWEVRGGDEVQVFKNRHGVSKPLILYVGGLKPHKNIPTLLRAVSDVRKSDDIQVGFVGESISANEQLQGLAENLQLKDAIISFGRLSQTDLTLAYQSALTLVLPSEYEGFGLPALEAMAAGVPVIGANATAIPEVMGGAGLLFDPHDVSDLAMKILSLLHEKQLRTNLIQRGRTNVLRFSWEQCARETLKIYESLESVQ